MRNFLPRLPIAAALALVGGVALLATPANAWWRGGVWIGVPPVVVGPAYYPPAYYPPAYYPPYYPGYYAPAPAATPVPQAQARPQSYAQSQGPVTYGATCYAGVYVCGAPAKSPVGGGCTCPGLGAPSYGVVN